MSSNGNDGLTSSSNEISFVSKNYLNVNKDKNFKKELLKVLEEGLKEGLKENFRKIIFYRSHN